jgi:HD superfamily phosphodiesterase
VQQRGLQGTIEHIDRKLLKLSNHISTKTGKALAEPRHDLLVTFMKTLATEFQTIGEPLPDELKPFTQR